MSTFWAGESPHNFTTRTVGDPFGCGPNTFGEWDYRDSQQRGAGPGRGTANNERPEPSATRRGNLL